MRLDQLPEQIRRCDAVVAAFPNHPGPLNDRYLLNSLAGREQAACQDIAKASALARTAAAGRVGPQVQQELKVRRELCRDPQHNIATPAPGS